MKKEYFEKYVKARLWNKPLEKSYCCPTETNGKPIKYLANTTWKGTDICAGGETKEEAEKALYNFA